MLHIDLPHCDPKGVIVRQEAPSRERVYDYRSDEFRMEDVGESESGRIEEMIAHKKTDRPGFGV